MYFTVLCFMVAYSYNASLAQSSRVVLDLFSFLQSQDVTVINLVMQHVVYKMC